MMKARFALLIPLMLTLWTADAGAQRRSRKPVSAPPSKAGLQQRPTALVVFLENDGIQANLETALGKRSSKIRIPVIMSGKACFALRKGEPVSQALLRLSDAIRELALNGTEALWKLEYVSPDEWVRRTSDFMLEEISKSFHRKSGIESLYDRVVMIEDRDLTPANALAELRKIGPGYDIDVHTLVHGGSEAFFGFKGARFDDTTFFKPLRAAKLSLRAVYQMNCVSGTLMDDWRGLGADVVNGTLEQRDNYVPHQYFRYQALWVEGDTFGNAITQSYAWAREISEPAYEALGMLQEIEDSRMQVSGNTGLRAKPTPLQIAKATVMTTLETANQIAKRMRAAGASLQAVAEAILAAGHDAIVCAAALRDEWSANAKGAARAMLRAGYDLADVGHGVGQTFACSTLELVRALQHAGAEIQDIVSVMLKKLDRSARDVTRALVTSGADTVSVLDALTSSTVGLSYTDAVDALNHAGVKASKIARALKAKGKKAADAARWLKRAGLSARLVAKALASEFSSDVRSAVRHLQTAGFGFADTAKAVWNEVIKKAPKHLWPAKIGDLSNELATRFQKNLAWVAAEISKLGIRP